MDEGLDRDSRYNKGCHNGLPLCQPLYQKWVLRQLMTMGFRLACIPGCFLSLLTEKREGIKADLLLADKIVFERTGCFCSALFSKISSIMIS